jgi:two-component system OmpR family response regulator
LVADDEETVTAILTIALETSGLEVEVAHSGPDAYERGRDGQFDIIVLDQLMPGMLGIEIIQKWRADGVDTPVIMVSGVDDDRVVIHSLELGVLDFVRKPFRITELTARILRSFQTPEDNRPALVPKTNQ